MGWGPTSRAVQRLAWTTTGSVQTREKHYISYRLESEHDPYRHLRRKKKQQKPNHAALTDLLEDEVEEKEAEAAYTSSPSLSDFFRRVATKLDNPQSSSSRHPAEAVAAWAEATGSGALGTAGGLVQRSKTAIPIRYVPETSNHGRTTAPSAGEQSHQQQQQQREAPELQAEAGDVHRHRDLSPSGEGPRSGPMVEDESSSPSSSPSSSTTAAWMPQAVKDTGRKVVESVGDAAASVTHTAKQVGRRAAAAAAAAFPAAWRSHADDDTRTPNAVASQLWVGALGAVGSNPHESTGIVDKAKDVGKETAHVVDSTYEKAVEKAADKMLEALDAALHRAKARGFPPGLTVTTIASAMGAQMIMAYTTKDDDAASEAGRKNANDAAPETRRSGGRGGRRKSSNNSKLSKPTAEEAASSNTKKKQ